MSTRIEKHWNHQLFKSWVSVAFISLILQVFFQAIREVKLLNESYQSLDLLRYLSVESFIFLMEFLPVTLFIAALNLQDEWKKKDYYLNALLDGVSVRSWRLLSVKNTLALLIVWGPLWFWAMPHLSYDNTLYRLEKLGRVPEIDSNKIYLLEKDTLAYVEGADPQVAIFQLEKNSIQPSADFADSIAQWREKFVPFALGIDKQVIWKRAKYWENSQGKEQSLLASAFVKDGMYIFSLILCWIFISIDREHNMFSTKREENSPGWTRRIAHICVLYWGTKIMPLLARFFMPTGILFGYASIVGLSFLL